MKRLLNRICAMEKVNGLLKELYDELEDIDIEDDFLLELKESLEDRYDSEEIEQDLLEVVNYNMRIESGDIEGEKIILEHDDGKVRIEDPFYDETGRSRVNPIEYYGKEKIDKFIKEYQNSVNNEKQDR